ncbi:MAG: pyrroline-5-carboxylate reductase [Pseudomonadota bacterium]
MTELLRVALVGAGSMGLALFRGWLSQGRLDARGSCIFDPAPSNALREICDRHQIALNPAVTDCDANVVVIAIKPQAVEDVLPTYAGLAGGCLAVSVMAGTSTETIASFLEQEEQAAHPRVIRAMPNLPAQVGAGITGLFAPDGSSDDDKIIAETLMSAVGETVWVATEDQLDVVTALSGSGPAFLMAFAEAMARAGVAKGLAADTAAKLARQTLAGTGTLLVEDDRALADLRAAVTSPGGTTAAGLDAILKGDKTLVDDAASAAIRAATDRAHELKS